MHAHHMFIHHVDQMGCPIATPSIILREFHLNVLSAYRARHKQNPDDLPLLVGAEPRPAHRAAPATPTRNQAAIPPGTATARGLARTTITGATITANIGDAVEHPTRCRLTVLPADRTAATSRSNSSVA